MASTPTRDLPEEFLAATRKSQDAMIRAIRTWVETVRTVTPRLPSGPLTDRLPKLPSVTVPFADRLPTPEDVVATGYDFAERLLAVQRKFAEDLLAATEPLIPGNGKRTWQDATKGDAAAAAHKTVAAAKTAVTGTVHAAEKAVAEVTPATSDAKAPAATTRMDTPAATSAPKAPAATTPEAPATKTTPEAPAATATPTPATPKAADKPATPKPATTPKSATPKATPSKPAATSRPAAAKAAAPKSAANSAAPRRAPKGTGTS